MEMRAYKLLLWAMLCLPTHAFGNFCDGVHVASGQAAVEESWRATGLTYHTLKSIIHSPPGKRESETDVVAAMASINSLLHSLEVPLFAMPADFGSSELPSSTVVQRFGPVIIAQMNEPMPLHQINDLLRPEWKRLHSKNTTIDFGKLLEWSIAKCDPNHEALLVGRALNAGFHEKDSHSRIVPKQITTEELASEGTRMAGVGVQLVEGDKHTLIVGLIPGGPAEEAGVKSHDRVLRIDGVSVKDIPKGEVTSRFIGPAGEKVRVVVNRHGKEIEYELERREIVAPIALSRELHVDGRKFGYIQIKDFSSEHLVEQTRDAIRRFEKNGAKGLVIDLRWNPGGNLAITMEFLGLFLGPNRHILTEMDLKTQTGDQIYSTGEKITDLPLTVLVNGGSASASEIVAGTLQQTGRGYVVGERTYGKGTVQTSLDLSQSPGPFAGLPLLYFSTSYMYFIPPGRSPQIHGVPPDFVAHLTPDRRTDLPLVREEDAWDAYPNPGLALDAPKREKTQEIRRCLSQTGTATQAYYSTRDNPSGHDYQLLVAGDVLRCLFAL